MTSKIFPVGTSLKFRNELDPMEKIDVIVDKINEIINVINKENSNE